MTTHDTDGDSPPAIRAAVVFLKHLDIIRCPPCDGGYSRDNGRELTADESDAESAALDLLRCYFLDARRFLFPGTGASNGDTT
ncbi:hypothetical protein VT84_30755 [Gemmata sp. SH-PL17]|uniref:hypothetical protein n=1 Tax=Gemmata sp. SH-PL17 TaxID=1630693 RepID=UPI00078E6E46|nr:hypothetical protein [Gemmata sp. SH-PL17]AMV28814.1 hypothetical protein VT84_30755 [Gemmata sp. SH-PL17]